MPRFIGIDLGTSNSAAAVMEGGRPVIIPSSEGGGVASGKAFPSFVAFTKDRQRLVGEPARRQAAANPEGTIYAAKRKMGTDARFNAFGKEYTPQQISASILQKIKFDAEKYLGDSVEGAVITVPAYFNDNQRQATRDAGEIAGLTVLRIINEPMAACLACGLDKIGKGKMIMVFDLGGGTLDVTILKVHFGGTFEVLSTSGDCFLGGTDMDNALMGHLMSEFKKETGVDLCQDQMAFQRLREAAEKAKIELSSTLLADINLPFIAVDAAGPKHMTQTLDRATLERLVSPIIERCRYPIHQAVKDASAKAGGDIRIDKLIMIGGPTRMPVVQNFVEAAVNRKIERGIDPMECVALGAAVQAGLITGDVKDVFMLDVTPLTLGIETVDGVMTTMIERNTTVPTKMTYVFPAADDKSAFTVRLVQGALYVPDNNSELGRFDLVGIPPASRGVPPVEVIFHIDVDGIVHLYAKDKSTGKEQSIRITSPHRLSDREIYQMVREAERFAGEDKRRKEEAEAVNKAHALIYLTERSLKDFGARISPGDRGNILDELERLKEAVKDKTVQRILSGIKWLTKASRPLKAAASAHNGASDEPSRDTFLAGAPAPRYLGFNPILSD